MVKRPPQRALRAGPRAAVTAVAFALPLLAAAAPLLPEPARGALMTLFDPLCHQIPERSFALAGAPFALCQRCFGVVAGLALGAAFAPALARILNPADGRGLKVLVLAAIPMAADWALGLAGPWTNTPLSRTLTGAIFGLAAGALLVLSVAAPAPAETERVARLPDG